MSTGAWLPPPAAWVPPSGGRNCGVKGLVSVVMPVRNGMPFFPAALASVIHQTYGDLEILVVDDGSDDGSLEAAARCGDDRVRMLRSPGRGIATALNYGCAHATGEVIARQDADDWSRPERIERLVGFLSRHSDVDVVGSRVEFVDERDRPMTTPWTEEVRKVHDRACSPQAIRGLLPLTCCLAHGSTMVRTSVMRDAGGYRESFEAAQDYDLWLRLLPQHRFAKLAEPLYRYRVHDNRVTARRRHAQLLYTIEAKLQFLRRQFRALPRPAMTLILGDGRGADAYRASAARHDLVEPHAPSGLAGVPSDVSGIDLVIATDFPEIVGVARWLSHSDGEWDWEGNFFVRH